MQGVHNQMTNDLGHMQTVDSLRCGGDFHTPGRPFTASLPTGYLLGWVVSLTSDAHPLAGKNLRPIGMDLLQPHPH
ncbi:hypothetical protein O181_024244 [Austropuccinia psidii MF-1]|uniref:Uncharacterized protein n=1 Tax=Austropuccinia psidii MF-1 TaxID=1389203 RepID=A0A9Q3CFX7_9BASI|nr:hypothetical protein [Austropuccinia psidii MF-1]